nr:reverse transcriptase domain-containing protein [Tanacetum cinerariifolium]
MRTRSRSRSRNKSPQREASPAIVEPLRIELLFLEDQFQEDPPPESLIADNRTMAELLQAPTEGYEDAIVIPEITANNFEFKHGLINLVQNKQFFGHDKEDPACPHHGFSELHQLDTFYNALNVNDQDSLNSAAGGNFLDKMPRECLKIIKSKSKVRQSRAKAVVAKGITTRSGVAYHRPKTPSPSKQGTKVTKDQVQTPSSQNTAPVQPLVIQSESQASVSEPVVSLVSALMPNLKPFIPYPSRRDNEKRHDQANEQIEKFYEIFKEMSFEISFTDALILMPKFASTLKA